MLSNCCFFALTLLASGPTEAPVIVERILAVVDEDPITQSDAQIEQHLKGSSRADALEALIDERLMYREARRFPQAVALRDEETQAFETLWKKHGDQSASALRRIAHRQVTIVKYIDSRFRPQIRISREALRQRYERLHAAQSAPPPLESVAGEIQERLIEEQLNERIEGWIRELRSLARIRYTSGPL
ncbi:MAG: hypothetical protein MUF51_00680 [Vicinamibacteria bacterium]|jgi:hypothetical protein|nr:hypothetical protein [Vicinamibacteria bacterium]